MALHWSTFFTRLGSAVVFCAIMMVGLLWNELSLLALLSVIQVLCIKEYYSLLKKIYPQYSWPISIHILLQVAALASLVSNCTLLDEVYVPYLGMLVLAISIVLAVCAVAIKKLRSAVGFTFLGWLYIGLPMLLLSELYIADTLLPLMVILMIWCNDTLAYLVGSFIGKTPFSKISPKKTWEGTGGGVLLTLVSVGIWAYFKETNHSIGVWVGLALVVAIIGTLGDLLESKLKRMADVKDSGTMMPGHGGALDRFDSLLIATPFAFVYAYVFMF